MFRTKVFSLFVYLSLVMVMHVAASGPQVISKSGQLDKKIYLPMIMKSGIAYKLIGMNFSPYIDGQNPNYGSYIPESQIRSRLSIIAPYVNFWVRTFGMTDGLEKSGKIIHEFGLQSALGVWLSSDSASNEVQIANAIAAALAGEADMIIVGSEVLLRGDLSEDALIAYINRVRAAVPAGVQITTADIYSILLAHPKLVAVCDSVMANFYPYWESVKLDYAVASINAAYEKILTAYPGKMIFVSETGWPSCGNAIGEAVPSPANAAAFFLNFVSWARARTVPYLYFEAFDESWKAAYEGPQGACWGVFDKNGTLKPGMQDVFDGKIVPDNWTGNDLVGGPGTPNIIVTTIPTYNTSEDLRGHVLHIRPRDFKIVVYLSLYTDLDSWWVKPYASNPATAINPDGTWVCDVTTGGADAQALRYRIYLIPNSVSPYVALGGPISSDMDLAAIAKVEISRTP
jgi:exo-beta-1,3-glucanase (GH17 family)